MSEHKENHKDLVPTCGIVMPISEIDGCSALHWDDVRQVLTEAAESAGFVASLVSQSEEIGIIHNRIVQNLYNSDLVVCDVSRKNPNVMFELGLRLAFDKPVIVIKDDKTDYSFDTSPIEHLSYPSNLHYQSIIKFKYDLIEKMKSTHEFYKKNPNASPFIKTFGDFKRVEINEKEVTASEYILEEIRSLKVELFKSRSNAIPAYGTRKAPFDVPYIDICLTGVDDIDSIRKKISALENVADVKLRPFNDHKHLSLSFEDKSDAELTHNLILRTLRGIVPRSRIRFRQ